MLSDKGYDLVITAVLLDVKRDKQHIPGHVEGMPYDYYDSLDAYWYTAGDTYDPGYWGDHFESGDGDQRLSFAQRQAGVDRPKPDCGPRQLAGLFQQLRAQAMAGLFHEGVLK